jgi:hypothetical protein
LRNCNAMVYLIYLNLKSFYIFIISNSHVDWKILSHVLAQRLKKILSKLINEDQTGYIKNRFIGFNLRQIQNILDYATK